MSEEPRNPLDDIAEAFRHLRPGIVLPAVLFVALGIYFMTGIYTVKPGEQGVVRRFGRVIGPVNPGAHYRLPWPVDSVEIVNVSEVRRAAVGQIGRAP